MVTRKKKGTRKVIKSRIKDSKVKNINKKLVSKSIRKINKKLVSKPISKSKKNLEKKIDVESSTSEKVILDIENHGRIVTGVDLLYEILQKEKKVYATKVAKELNVSKDVILEWSEILEENKLVKLHYGIFKQIIEVVSEEERQQAKESEVIMKKQGLVRRIESIRKSLVKEEENIEKFKELLPAIRKNISSELSHISRELHQLHKFEKTKHELSEQIFEMKKNKIPAYHMDMLQIMSKMDKIESEISHCKEQIVSKINLSTKYVSQSQKKKLIKHLSNFFDKKERINKVILELEKEHSQILSELDEILKEVKAADSKTKNLDDHLKDLEIKLEELDKKRMYFRNQIVELNEQLITEIV